MNLFSYKNQPFVENYRVTFRNPMSLILFMVSDSNTKKILLAVEVTIQWLILINKAP
jgi:hypothetical protein